MIITLRKLLATGHTQTSAQNALNRAAEDALKSGYKVVRVSSVSTDEHHRVRRIVREVRVS